VKRIILSLVVLLFMVSIIGACAFRCPCGCFRAKDSNTNTNRQIALNKDPKPKTLRKHPKLSSQQKLIACATCHKEVTPKIYKQWYNSGHGLDNVKCFQCHGTYENFRAIPDPSTCAACHAKEYKKSVTGKTCWQCHPAHRFTVHK